jgi:predicted nucleotidyltransferase
MTPVSREEIKAIIIDLLKPYGVRRIGLFGSYARREERPDSDVDILVSFSKKAGSNPLGLRWFTLDQEIAKRIGRSVDLVTEESLPAALRPEIERDLEIIYEQAG